ncbi:MAG TPA: hypothetical protein VMT56_00425 [Candidatus Bathyarchaeia archaeon]|nr:hypothetical protein [Candidatus Bathyarchaeia archaeon]
MSDLIRSRLSCWSWRGWTIWWDPEALCFGLDICWYDQELTVEFAIGPLSFGWDSKRAHDDAARFYPPSPGGEHG